jgi:CHAT domain-containing protein
VKRAAIAAALIATTAAVCAADAPPRSIADITALLHQYKPDPEKTAKLRATLERKAPEGASKSDLARFHREQADAASMLGMQASAAESWRRALEQVRGDQSEVLHLRGLWVTEQTVGNNRSGLEIGEELLKNRFAGPGAQVPTNFGIARIYSAIGDAADAKKAWERGNAILEQIRNAPQSRLWLLNWQAAREWTHGDVLLAAGKPGEAEAALRRAMNFFDEDLKGAAKARQDLTGGQFTVDSVEAGREVTEFRLVDALTAQGKLFEAEWHARDALKRTLSRTGRDSPMTGGAVIKLSKVLLGQGRFKDAETLSREALGIYERVGAPDGSSFRRAPYALMANAHFGREEWKEAAAQLDLLRASVEKSDDLTRRVFRGSPETTIVLVKVGRGAEALKMSAPLLEERVRNFGAEHPQTAEVRGAHAMALVAAGRQNDALREFSDAVKVMLSPEAAVFDVDGSALQRLKKRLILEAYIELLYELRDSEALKKSGLDAAGEAFRIADAARGGSVQKALAQSAARALANEPGLGDLIRKEQDGVQEARTLYEHLLRLMAQPAEQQLPGVIAAMRSRLTQIEKERRQIYADIEKRYPEYANLASPRPSTLEDAGKALRPGEALLSVLSTRDRSFVWSIDGAGKKSFHLADIGERAIAAAVKKLRRTLDPGEFDLATLPPFDYAAAHELYAKLLAPAEGVWGGARTLVVAASGALAQIPLAVLPTQAVAVQPDKALRFAEMKDVPWLARRIAVADVPSVTALARLRSLPAANPKRAAFAGFGDPLFKHGTQVAAAAGGTRGAIKLRSANITRVAEGADTSASSVDWSEYGQLAPLPDTRDEILSIAGALGADAKSDVFLGTAANRQQVMKADLRGRRIVAFATHGLIPGDLAQLEQPALALSVTANAKDSPLLTLEDVLGLKLDADWVVLSACNTAAADGEGAEAVSGLGRGFFYAGTRALLVTHWPVESVSARLLTTGIFERYSKEAAATRAETLRASMLELMQKATPEYSYAHPIFWAPYALIGDGGR